MAVRVYERYSMTGGNRVSMNVTVLGVGNELLSQPLPQEVAKLYF